MSSLLVLALLSAAEPARPDPWGLSCLGAEEVPPSSVRVFCQLLRQELAQERGSSPSLLEGCTDPDCVKAAAAQKGLAATAQASLLRLGGRTIVRVELIETASGRVAQSHRLVALRDEDLEPISARVAKALATGKSVEGAAEVDTVVSSEAMPTTTRRGRSGFGLSAVGVVPQAGSYADGTPGAGLQLSYWFETKAFAIEPRVAFHLDGDLGPSRFVELVPLEVGAYWVPLGGDLSPFVGASGGLHSLYERRPVTVKVGEVVTTTNDAVLEQQALGFGGSVRAGLLLFRTYRTRVLVSAEYAVTFVKINERSNPRALRVNVGVIF